MPVWGDFVPELVCMGVDFATCLLLYKAYDSTNWLLKELTSAPQISIDEHLQSRISNHPSSLLSDEGATSTIPFAVVRGEVAPLGKTVTSAYAKGYISGVIQKVVFTEHKRNMSRTGFWVDNQRVIHQYTNDAPFCLTNSQSFSYFVLQDPWWGVLQRWSNKLNPSWDSIFSLMRPHVEVVDWSDASRVDLDTVYDQFESAPGGFSNHIWGWVVGDMHKGVQKTEMMLTKNTTMTGIGELVAGPDGVKLQPPSDGRPFYLVKSTLASLVKETETSRTVVKVMLILFGGVGVCIAGAAAWKFYKKLKAEKEVRVNQDRLDSIRADRETRSAAREGRELPDSMQCVVCLGAEREVILLNCGHVCVCADCAEQLLQGGHQCPVCRAVIERVMPAYLP